MIDDATHLLSSLSSSSILDCPLIISPSPLWFSFSSSIHRVITLHKPPRAELRVPLMYTQRWIDVRDEELLADRDVTSRNHRDA